MEGTLFGGFPDGWFNRTARSTITGLIFAKTRMLMLDAYKKFKRLKELEAQLPKGAVEAKQTLKNILVVEPTDGLALLNLARCYLLCDEISEAKLTLEALISQEPVNVSAKVELAKILYMENDLQGAIRLLVDATNTRPDFDENWLLLSKYLQHNGQQKASKEALNQYDMIKAFNDKLAVAEKAFGDGDFVQADKICRHLMGLVPAEVRTLRLLARLAKRFHHIESSISILAQCVETQPGNAALGVEYGYSLLVNKKHQEALEQCERLIGIAPENIDIYELKAEVLYNLGRYAEAIAIYRELSEADECRVRSLLHLGKVLKAVGETPKAIMCYHEAMKDELLSSHAYWELANLKTYRFSADEVTAMQALLKAGELTAINKVLIQFALGKALEDEKRFAESFQHYQAANSGYSKIRPYRYSNQNASLKAFFTAEYFADRKGSGSTSDAPIFVVGLPRSGSTLVEQILSAHSKVDATRELSEIALIARELNNSNQPGQEQYPRSMANLSASQIQKLAQRYLDFVQTFRQQAPYFVDKAPPNFHLIGVIKTLLPRAKIIDIRRNPMASGWSVYRHFFADSFHFSYDLTTIGKYYNHYVELMDHWHTVLPEQILTISYEELIDDLPATVERMLQYCGLEFEETCLNFHLNKRAVATPSSEQVRLPLYTDAIDHWKNYEEFLAPLKDALKK